MQTIRPFRRLRGAAIHLAACASLLLAACGPAETAAAAAPIAWDRTLAAELLQLELENGNPPENARAMLEAVLEDAYAASGGDRPPPSTQSEFRDFALKVSTALAKHNFIQPVAQAEWVNSLGQAFRPVSPTDPRVTAYLAHAQNAQRRPFVDPGKPFYFVDCDMAALLILSVAQMAGFDLSLVHVPSHEFVRWQGPAGSSANWDWTNWGSFDEDYYRRRYAVSQAQEHRKVFLTSQRIAAARGYFIASMSRNVKDPLRKLNLRRKAAALSANDPVTASNVAWSFATARNGVTPAERVDALPYALTGWAAAPDSAVHMNAVACALAARREHGLAVALQERAIEEGADSDLERYRSELVRLKRKELC
ncbi:MAG TPA: hypothetical protein VF782_13000 [Allosphingosinicella sp.]|jgi:hypothetical protein